MRRPLSVVLVLLVLVVLGAAGCRRLQGGGQGDLADRRPPEAVDVILVTIDTWRADAFGAATPLLGRLAKAGRVYVNAHSHNVLTLPSHTNILTGRYPFDHGVRDNSGFTVPAGVPTLATLLKQAGYATGAFVGAYPLDARFGLNRGFDVYDDHYPRGSNPSEFVMAARRGDQVVAPALAWWRSQAGKPRFLWVHLYDPHASYDPPEPFKSRFAAKPYLGEVAAADSFLEPLLGPVLEGKEKPALVVVTGDHGEALGEHGELTHGLFAYESTLHVPLIVWGAGVHPGRDERWARHVDIVPTVLERLGLNRPEGMPGRSLLAPPPEKPDDSYFESLSSNLNRGWAPLRGVIRGGRKWIELPIPELYNLPVDPKEEKNLASEDRRTVAELRKALPEEAVWPPRKGAVSPEEERRLRSLGYSVGSATAKAVYTPDDDPKRLIGIDHKLQQVVDLYSRGRYAEAVALSREVIAERPDMAEAYEHAALSLQVLERQDEAVAVLRSGLGKVVADESLRRHLALALSESGRPAEAVEILRPFEQTGELETRAVLGYALSDAGRNEEGERVLRRLVAEDETDPQVHEKLGIILLRMSRAAEARAELQRALELNDSLPSAWNTLGVALYQLEGPEAALTAWRKAYELDPRQYDALFNTGLVAASLGRRDVAREALAQFVRTAPPQRFAADIQKAQAILREIGG
ncbi:MAG TPA: sulfatase-like hydrolase/transferase [Thermoanaerobaculia bacterium]|jgi:arylsulfatase A-like enzyme/tetratricopeptide (TPR) repeat protein|nr:sulfatase-like hydrolase/transferase [Thermoanaerobaculia bacterium]